MHFLCLLGGCHLASPDGPHWLVGNNDIRPARASDLRRPRAPGKRVINELHMWKLILLLHTVPMTSISYMRLSLQHHVGLISYD